MTDIACNLCTFSSTDHYVFDSITSMEERVLFCKEENLLDACVRFFLGSANAKALLCLSKAVLQNQKM